MDILESTGLGPFRVNRFGDRYLIRVNRERFDSFGADSVYKQKFGKIPFQKNTLYVVIGTDSGLLPKYVLQRGLPEGTRFLFVELPEVLDRIGEMLPEGCQEDRVAYSLPAKWRETAAGLCLQEYAFINAIEVIPSCAAEDVFWPPYREVEGRVKKEVQRYTLSRQSSLGTEVFTKRQLENLGENRTNASCLKGLFPGKTAVLLGGGPSLDDILPWLHAHREQVVVISVSRVSRRLQDVGLCPDIVVSVDPHSVSFDVSNEMFAFEGKTLFVHSYHVLSPLLGQWGGRSVYWGPLYPWESPRNEDSRIAMGPTVTNLALDTAVEMGFSQVVLAGVDLCYSRDGYSHAQGSREHEVGVRIQNGYLQVDTYGGWPADTVQAYADASLQIASQAEKALVRGCRIVNSAPGALKIPCVAYAPLDEIVVDPLQRPPSEIIGGALPVESSATRCSHYRDVLGDLALVHEHLTRIRKLSVSALKANGRLFSGHGKAVNFKYKSRLEKIEKALDEDFGDISRLVKKCGVYSFIQVTRPSADRELTESELERVGRVYYQAYRDTSVRLLVLVEKAQARLQARLEEESATPDLSLLVGQWRNDHQPGRLFLWRNRHAELNDCLPSEEQEMLCSLEKEYFDLIEKGFVENTGATEVKSAHQDSLLWGACDKIISLYRKQEKEKLEQLIDVLTRHPSDNAGPLLVLAKAFLAELNDDVESALEMYQDLMDEEPGPLLEEALRAFASLSLKIGAHDDALLAFEGLSAISPVYMPMFAQALKVLGEKGRALDVYAAYLEEVPEDCLVMLDLGTLYRELNVEEGARLMFTHVLEIDPDNQAARVLLDAMGESASD